MRFKLVMMASSVGLRLFSLLLNWSQFKVAVVTHQGDHLSLGWSLVSVIFSLGRSNIIRVIISHQRHQISSGRSPLVMVIFSQGDQISSRCSNLIRVIKSHQGDWSSLIRVIESHQGDRISSRWSNLIISSGWSNLIKVIKSHQGDHLSSGWSSLIRVMTSHLEDHLSLWLASLLKVIISPQRSHCINVRKHGA